MYYTILSECLDILPINKTRGTFKDRYTGDPSIELTACALMTWNIISRIRGNFVAICIDYSQLTMTVLEMDGYTVFGTTQYFSDELKKISVAFKIVLST